MIFAIQFVLMDFFFVELKQPFEKKNLAMDQPPQDQPIEIVTTSASAEYVQSQVTCSDLPTPFFPVDIHSKYCFIVSILGLVRQCWTTQQQCIDSDTFTSFSKLNSGCATKNMLRLMNVSCDLQIRDFMSRFFSQLPSDFWDTQQDALECLQLTFPRIYEQLTPRLDVSYSLPDSKSPLSLKMRFPLFFEVESEGSYLFRLQWERVFHNILTSLNDQLGSDAHLLSIQFNLPPEFIVTCTSYKDNNAILLPLIIRATDAELYVISQMTMSTSRIVFDGKETKDSPLPSPLIPLGSSGHHIDVQLELDVLKISPTFFPEEIFIQTTSTSSLRQRSRKRNMTLSGRDCLYFSSQDPKQEESYLFSRNTFPNVIVYQQLGLAQTLALKRDAIDFKPVIKDLYFQLSKGIPESVFRGQKFFIACRAIHRVLVQHQWMHCRASITFFFDSIKSWKTIGNSVAEVEALIDLFVAINPTTAARSQGQVFEQPVEQADVFRHIQNTIHACHQQFPKRVVVLVTNEHNLTIDSWGDEVIFIQLYQDDIIGRALILQQYCTGHDGYRCSVSILHATGRLFQDIFHPQLQQIHSLCQETHSRVCRNQGQLVQPDLDSIHYTNVMILHSFADSSPFLDDGIICCQFASMQLSSFPLFNLPPNVWIIDEEVLYYRHKFFLELEQNRTFLYDSFFGKIHRRFDDVE